MFHCLFKPFCRSYQRMEFQALYKYFPNIFCATMRNPHILQKSTSEKDSVSSSTIVIQDGLNIQELPLVIKKTKTLNVLSEENVPKDALVNNENTKQSIELQANLDQCDTLEELFDLLEVIPFEDVTPAIAAYSLKRMANLYINAQYRNERQMNSEKNSINTFSRNAVVVKLSEITCESKEISTVLDGLRAVLRCNTEPEDNLLVEKFVNECLLRICDGKASINEICEFASLAVTIKRGYSTILDKLWSSVLDRFQEIDSNNLVKLYKLLPLLKHSRSVIFRILEKRTYICWWQLTTRDVNEILTVLVKLQFQPQKLLLALSKWVHLHIHTISESELITIVSRFQSLNYLDYNIKHAIERYVKVKNPNINDPALIAIIMQFLLHFRVQSNVILDCVANYFIIHGSNMSTLHITNIITPFGALNYVPKADAEFYKKLEEVLMEKFVQFRPQDVIELLLSCTYIQRYPLNFVRQIFNPHFLERLSAIQDSLELKKAHNNLRLLDMAMTLECRRYRGPLLPRDRSAQSLHRDGRIIKIINRLSDALGEMLGGFNLFLTNKWLQQYPLSEMYIIDFVLHFNRDGTIMSVDEKSRLGKKKAVVIHMPEHYCHNSKCLTGPQSAKNRLLQRLGYEVIHLDYDEVSLLYSRQQDLLAYLQKKLLQD